MLAVAAPATAGVRWREIARGSTVGGSGPEQPVGVLVGTRARSRTIAKRLPADGRASLSRVEFSRSLVVAIFGDFGCTDHRVAVRSISRRGAALRVVLVTRPLPPDQMECQAIFGTYRLLVVAKAQLGTPLPTRAEVTHA